MAANTNGSYNTVLGGFALFSSANGNYNTAVGEEALNQSQGSGNIALGYQAGRNSASGSTNIYIGHAGNSTENNTIRIGTPGSHSNTYIAGIVTDVGGVQVGSSGTVIANLQAGQAIMPPSLLQETNFTIAFPTAYSSTPKILFSIANDPGFQNVSDVFASSISSNGPSGFSVNVYRLNGTSWGQSLRVNWQAWQ